MEKPQIFSRFEVIDTEGRAVVHYGHAETSIQDEGRTLKVWIKTKLQTVNQKKKEERLKRALMIYQETVKKLQGIPEYQAQNILLAYALAEEALKE